MNRKLALAAIVGAVFMSAPVKAQVMIEMSEIACKQFSEYDDPTKDFIANWMRGFFSAKNNITVVDSAYVKRNSQKVLRYCKKIPKSSLMDAVQKNAR